MATNRLFLYLSLGLFIFTSCNSTTSDNSGSFPLIESEATYCDGVLDNTILYNYDQNGRQIKRINITNTSYSTNLFEYTSTSVDNREYNVNEVSHWANLGDLDYNNLVSNYLIVEDGITKKTGTMEYINGFLIREVVNSWDTQDIVTYSHTILHDNTVFSSQEIVSPASIIYTKYSPTLMAKPFLPAILLKNQEERFKADTKQRSAGYYTYTYVFNNIKNTIGLENTGIDCYGKQNKNLISYFTTGDGQTVNFSYQFDNLGRVVKQNWAESGHSYFTKFTYLE